MKKNNLLALFFVCLFAAVLFWKHDSEIDNTSSEDVVVEAKQTSTGESETLKESVGRVLKRQEENDTPQTDAVAADVSASDETETEAVFEDSGYYFAQLSDTEKKVYAEIYHALVNHKEVELSTLSADVIEKINVCVTNDHPEIFNVYGYTYTTHTRDDKIVSVLFRGKYTYDEAEEVRINGSIEAEVGMILNSAPMNGTDFEKIKFVYDTLVNNTSYREDAKDNQNIASVFLYHESVCQGYSKATQYLLNRLGIEATLIVGETDSGAHSWNLVKADGAWYYLDTTWGDADFKNEDTEAAVQNARPISYDYFLVDSNTLLATHSPTRTVPLPVCTAKEDNYFIHEELYLTGLDTEVIGRIFENGYAAGAESVQFKCANATVFEQVKDYLIEKQHIFDFVKTSGAVNYTVFEDTNTFCFWLFNS